MTNEESEYGDNDPKFDNSMAPYEQYDINNNMEDDMGWGFLFAGVCVIVILFGWLLMGVCKLLGII